MLVIKSKYPVLHSREFYGECTRVLWQGNVFKFEAFATGDVSFWNYINWLRIRNWEETRAAFAIYNRIHTASDLLGQFDTLEIHFNIWLHPIMARSVNNRHSANFKGGESGRVLAVNKCENNEPPATPRSSIFSYHRCWSITCHVDWKSFPTNIFSNYTESK